MFGILKQPRLFRQSDQIFQEIQGKLGILQRISKGNIWRKEDFLHV